MKKITAHEDHRQLGLFAYYGFYLPILDSEVN